MKEEIKCRRCGSRFGYYRISTREVVCRRCGYIEKKEFLGLDREVTDGRPD